LHMWLQQVATTWTCMTNTLLVVKSVGLDISCIVVAKIWSEWTTFLLLNEHFLKFKKKIHLLGSIDFEISIISRILCILMFLIIAFRKSLKNITPIFFLELFGHKHKFETWFMIFFSKVTWKSLFFVFYLAINWLNMI